MHQQHRAHTFRDKTSFEAGVIGSVRALQTCWERAISFHAHTLEIMIEEGARKGYVEKPLSDVRVLAIKTAFVKAHQRGVKGGERKLRYFAAMGELERALASTGLTLQLPE